ncbi:MAG: hypothetical protein MUE30_01035 [Spirosomaceae bacterium]|jgi:hypothetical protein|nr:hypothetical protein [Spirosomataceae bacterium]
MSENFFDAKNDRRLSVYLYRLGFGLWLGYILLGASFMNEYAAYRTHCALLCAFMMVAGLSASLYHDYYHDHAEFEKKKKLLIVTYLLLAVLLYFFVFKDSNFSFSFAF